MVLTDRQRHELHVGIYEYLKSREGDAFQQAADALAQADPDVIAAQDSSKGAQAVMAGSTILEKKWTAIPRLQKKVLELERAVAHNTKIHAHRMLDTSGDGATSGSTQRRMLPRLPATHTLQGHSEVVLTVQVHPVFTVVVSGSEDGTIKVSFVCCVGSSLLLYACAFACRLSPSIYLDTMSLRLPQNSHLAASGLGS